MIAGIGGISFIATGNWNPIEVIQAQSHGFALIMLLVLVVLEQWSTNTAAKLIPSALTLVNLSPRYINYRLGVVSAGIIGTLCFPWQILDNSSSSSLLGRLPFGDRRHHDADNTLIRRRLLNVPDLYSMTGNFGYSGGVNCAGIIAWVVAGGIAAHLSDYAFVIGFPLGAVLYCVLMKTLVLPTNPQQEVERGYADHYLAISVRKSWVDLSQGAFQRKGVSELGTADAAREDLGDVPASPRHRV